MNDDFENLEQPQDSIEDRVGTLEVKLAEQANLRAAMDTDLGDLKVMLLADRELLKSVGVTQSDHTARLTRLEAGQSDHTARLTRLETGMGEVTERLGAVETTLATVHVGVEAIRDLLTENLKREDEQGNRES